MFWTNASTRRERGGPARHLEAVRRCRLTRESRTHAVRRESSVSPAGMRGDLWVRRLRRCPVGGDRSKTAHRRDAHPTCPPASLTAVCRTMWSPRCSSRHNPHSYTHESVHLAPHARIKPPGTMQARPWTLGSLCRACRGAIKQIRECETPLSSRCCVYGEGPRRGGAELRVTWL